VELVRDWWRLRPEANIGARMGLCDDEGEGFIAFDFDDGEVVRRLAALFTSDAAPRGYAITRSGREGGGLHVICRTRVDQHNTKLAVGKQHIGELIGWGSYVVVPPSLHISGRRYQFVVGDLVDWRFGVAEQPLTTARKLLALIGIELAEPRQGAAARARGEATYGRAVAIDCPFRAHSNHLRQILSGSMPTGDRSQVLLDLGRLLWEGAATQGYALTVEEAAGVIRRVDEAGYWKFAGRRDPERWYIDKALETRAFLEQER
jgi:hypothetical protein